MNLGRKDIVLLYGKELFVVKEKERGLPINWQTENTKNRVGFILLKEDYECVENKELFENIVKAIGLELNEIELGIVDEIGKVEYADLERMSGSIGVVLGNEFFDKNYIGNKHYFVIPSLSEMVRYIEKKKGAWSILKKVKTMLEKG